MEDEAGERQIQGQPRQVREALPQNKKGKQGQGHSSVVAHFPSMGEALGSIPTPEQRHHRYQTLCPFLVWA